MRGRGRRRGTQAEQAISEDRAGRAVAAVVERAEDTKRAMRARGWDPKTRKLGGNPQETK